MRRSVSWYRKPDGSVSIDLDDDAGPEIMRLSPGDFFGERALLHGAPRAASLTHTHNQTRQKYSSSFVDSVWRCENRSR